MAKKTPAKVLAYKRKYYDKNRIKRLRYQKDRYWKKREEILEERKRRKLEDPEYAERERAYHREYYLKKKREKEMSG